MAIAILILVILIYLGIGAAFVDWVGIEGKPFLSRLFALIFWAPVFVLIYLCGYKIETFKDKL